jgi:hypothetical protein
MPAATQEAPAAQQQMALPSDVVSQQPVSLLVAFPHPTSSLTISSYHRPQSLSRNLSLDFVAERRRDARCAAASAPAMRCVAEGEEDIIGCVDCIETLGKPGVEIDHL